MSLRLKLSDTRVFEPQMRARLGTTAHFSQEVSLKLAPCYTTRRDWQMSEVLPSLLPCLSASERKDKTSSCPLKAARRSTGWVSAWQTLGRYSRPMHRVLWTLQQAYAQGPYGGPRGRGVFL